MNIYELIKDNNIDKLALEARNHIHMYPDLSEHETDTMNFICKELDRLGIKYEKGIADTGIVALINGNGNGNVVGIRADMDALPINENNISLSCRSLKEGVMHACGHDIHTSVLLGTAALLSKLSNSFKGSVKFFFQPAEESIGGAERMIKAGCLENPSVDYMLGLHVEPSIESGKIGLKYGKMYASSDMFSIDVYGKSCHGANPELGVDAIVIAANIINMVQSVISRNVAAVDSAVCTFGKIEGGNVGNQVADHVNMKGIIRTLDLKTRTFVGERLSEICKNTAEAMGGKAEIQIRHSYSPLINDNSVVDIVKGNAEQLLGDSNVIMEEFPQLSVEDFSYFAAEKPACFIHLGCRRPGDDSLQVLHNPDFNPDPDCIITGIALQVTNALKLLNS